MEAEKRPNRPATLRLAVRVLPLLEHVTESVDSLLVFKCVFRYPVVAPGENGDVTADMFFSGRPMGVGDLVGDPSSVCPDDEGRIQSTQR